MTLREGQLEERFISFAGVIRVTLAKEKQVPYGPLVGGDAPFAEHCVFRQLHRAVLRCDRIVSRLIYALDLRRVHLIAYVDRINDHRSPIATGCLR